MAEAAMVPASAVVATPPSGAFANAAPDANPDGRLASALSGRASGPPPAPTVAPSHGAMGNVLSAIEGVSAEEKGAALTSTEKALRDLMDTAQDVQRPPNGAADTPLKPGQRGKSLNAHSNLSPISPKSLTSKARNLNGSSPARSTQSRYKVSPKFEQFLQRNAGDHKTRVRREICKVHQQLIKETEADMNSLHWGAHGAEGLRKKLVHHSGTVAAAWRSFLDPDDKGSLSFGCMCVKLEQMGFGGHIKKLWSELDKDKDGFISLQDLDPQAAEALADFRTRVLDNFGSTLEWWKHATSHKPGMVRLTPAEFTKACQELGYTDRASVEYAFKCLRIGQGLHMYLTLEEIDPQAHFALKRADPCAEGIAAGLGRNTPCLQPEGGKSFIAKQAEAHRAFAQTMSSLSPQSSQAMAPITEDEMLLSPDTNVRPHTTPTRSQSESTLSRMASSPLSMTLSPSESGNWRYHDGPTTPTRQTRWIREISQTQRANMKYEKDMFMKMLKGTQDLSGMKFNFIVKYSYLYDAWREAFGFPDEKGRMNFVEFCDQVRKLGYVGNLKELFAELDKESTGFVSLKEFDPKVHTMIMSYKDMLRKKHDNTAKAWIASFAKVDEVSGQAWNTDNHAKVDEEAFTKHIKELGWAGDSHKLFKTLQREPRGKFLFLRDWDPPAYKAIRRQDPDMISEEHPKSAEEKQRMSFHERQDYQFKQRWVTHQSKLQRDETAKAAKEERNATMAAGDLATLKKALEKKWGSVGLAWKNVLDLDCHGRLSWISFADAMRRIGYLGDLMSLWRELGAEDVGYVTLGMFDKELDDELFNFRQQLADRFGNLITGFRVGLDVNRSGRLEETEFVKRFEEYGFQGNPKLLFKNLQAWQGRKYITLADVEQRHMEAYYREDESAITVLMPHDQGVSFTPKGMPNSAKLAAFHMSASAPTTPALSSKGSMTPKTPNARLATQSFRAEMRTSPSAPNLAAAPLLEEDAADLEKEQANETQPGQPQIEALASRDEGGALAVTGGTDDSNPLNRSLNRNFNLSNLMDLDTPTAASNVSDNYKTTNLAQWSRDIGKRYRTKLERLTKEEKDRHMGCKTLEQLRAVLVQRYGSIVTAWRSSLDKDGNGRLSFNEFAIVLRKNSFIGDLPNLWNSLVENGFVTLKALDEDSWNRIRVLRAVLLDRFGGLLPSWKFLARGEAFITEPDFRQRMTELNFWQKMADLEFEPVWNLRDQDNFFKMMYTDLMCEKGKRYLYCEDLEALLIGVPTNEQKKAWMGAKVEVEKVPWKDNAARGLDNLKGVMNRKFGCLYVAWWKGFDLNGAGSVSVKDFRLRANAIGYAGNMNALLKALGKTDDKEELTLRDIDEDVASRVELFTRLVDQRYGSFKRGWVDGMDDGSGMIDLPTFKIFCQQIGYPGDSRELFRTFKPAEFMIDVSGDQVDRRHLYFEDFGPLGFSDSGMSPSARRDFLKDCHIVSPKDRMPRHIYAKPGEAQAVFPLSGGSARRCEQYLSPAARAEVPTTALSPSASSRALSPKPMIAGAESPMSPARSPAFFKESLQSSTNSDSLAPTLSPSGARRLDRFAQQEAETKASLAQTREKILEEKGKDKGAVDTKSLLQAYIHKYGTLSCAWRQGFDIDGNGRVSFNEFCEAARRVAFAGNAKVTFKELDQDGDNMISFEEFAPEEAACIKEFAQHLLNTYGSYKAAFQKIDDNNNGWLELQEVTNTCNALGCKCDPKFLFNVLKREKGTRHVTLIDLERATQPIPGCATSKKV